MAPYCSLVLLNLIRTTNHSFSGPLIKYIFFVESLFLQSLPVLKRSIVAILKLPQSKRICTF